MIMVAASLSLIGLLQITIGEDVLYGDTIQRQQVAVFEDCKTNGFQEPQCAKWIDQIQDQECIDTMDVDSSECWKYRTWVIAHAEQELLLSEKENQE